MAVCIKKPTVYTVSIKEGNESITLNNLSARELEHINACVDALVKDADPKGWQSVDRSHMVVVNDEHCIGRGPLLIGYCDSDHVYINAQFASSVQNKENVLSRLSLKVAIKELRP